jgi:nucleoside-diphosphate-sugar epimerase
MATLSDEKILVTGAAGQIGFPIAAYLAKDNEVWGVARFTKPEGKERLEAEGVRTQTFDLASGNFSELPDDFSYVVHLAVLQGPAEYDAAITTNAEGTGLLLQHCRKAKAALIMSTHSVYKPWADSDHVFLETDPLGDVNAAHSPAYSVSKIGQEAVSRYCARAFELPVMIGRMNASYGPNGGLPAYQIDAVATGQPVTVRRDPLPYSLIHQDDINEQVAPLLLGATVPATIVNWAGDDFATVQEWCAYAGELAGVEAKVLVKEEPGTLNGSIASPDKRKAITGPCRIGWREGIRATLAARHPELDLAES